MKQPSLPDNFKVNSYIVGVSVRGPNELGTSLWCLLCVKGGQRKMWGSAPMLTPIECEAICRSQQQSRRIYPHDRNELGGGSFNSKPSCVNLMFVVISNRFFLQSISTWSLKVVGICIGGIGFEGLRGRISTAAAPGLAS